MWGLLSFRFIATRSGDAFTEPQQFSATTGAVTADARGNAASTTDTYNADGLIRRQDPHANGSNVRVHDALTSARQYSAANQPAWALAA